MKTTIQNIVRGICVNDGKILLAFHKADAYYFLPGGHLEFNESLGIALEREFMEELGIAAQCGELINVFEHSWSAKGVIQHEINFHFRVRLETPCNEPRSLVNHLSFEWVALDRLNDVRFLPASLLPVLLDEIAGKKAQIFISTL